MGDRVRSVNSAEPVVARGPREPRFMKQPKRDGLGELPERDDEKPDQRSRLDPFTACVAEASGLTGVDLEYIPQADFDWLVLDRDVTLPPDPRQSLGSRQSRTLPKGLRVPPYSRYYPKARLVVTLVLPEREMDSEAYLTVRIQRVLAEREGLRHYGTVWPEQGGVDEDDRVATIRRLWERLHPEKVRAEAVADAKKLLAEEKTAKRKQKKAARRKSALLD